MGGFVRRIFKTVFSQPKPVIAPVAQTVASTSPVTSKTVDVAKQKQFNNPTTPFAFHKKLPSLKIYGIVMG